MDVQLGDGNVYIPLIGGSSKEKEEDRLRGVVREWSPVWNRHRRSLIVVAENGLKNYRGVWLAPMLEWRNLGKEPADECRQ